MANEIEKIIREINNKIKVEKGIRRRKVFVISRETLNKQEEFTTYACANVHTYIYTYI